MDAPIKSVVSEYNHGAIDWVESIIQYYDHTRFDYRSLWGNRSHLAFHYGYYDDLNRHHRQAVVNTNRTLADKAHITDGDRVLDAGCGLGGSSFWLAKNRGARVVGINLVPSQLQYAQSEADRRKLSDRVSFCQADYTNTPFESDSFDVVWALESLCHCARKADFYAEAHRLLRPGGRLVIAEYMLTGITLGPPEQNIINDWLSGWSMPSLGTRQQHIDNAVASGLALIEVPDWSDHIRRSSLRLHWLAVICHWLSFGLNRVGLRSDVAHANLLSARYQYQALQQGLWQYRILVAEKPQ